MELRGEDGLERKGQETDAKEVGWMHLTSDGTPSGKEREELRGARVLGRGRPEASRGWAVQLV